MIRLEQVRIEIDRTTRREPWEPGDALRERASSFLRVPLSEIQSVTLARHAIDARKKPLLYDVCTVDVALPPKTEERLLSAKALRGRLRRTPEIPPILFRDSDFGQAPLESRPVVVGAGPAGLFCALALAEAGYRPILIERGDDTVVRDEAVRRYWAGGAIDPESNIQFGLGGAGAYSDGKLATGVRDREGLGAMILRTFVEMGAPADILYEAHPHIGTDGLKRVVENIRGRIMALGGEVCLRTKLVGISFDERSGSLSGIETTGGAFPVQALVLAIGHSARDTFAMLCRAGVVMEQKAFAVGFRVAHPQETIDRAQYGMPAGRSLPPAIYKLTARAADGRGVYSFCMCPGGRIIDAASEDGGLCVNGMSERARDGAYANSAIVVTVTPEDYRTTGVPLEGVDFQRKMEQRARAAGKGRMPFACWRDFANTSGVPAGGAPAGMSDPAACFCGGFQYADLSGILPRGLNEAIVSAMPVFGRQIRGFDAPETLLAGVESRTSSPVRIPRADDGQALSHAGLYPCGEGAGYAGGILSAAMDGMRTARRIVGRFAPPRESGG